MDTVLQLMPEAIDTYITTAFACFFVGYCFGLLIKVAQKLGEHV